MAIDALPIIQPNTSVAAFDSEYIVGQLVTQIMLPGGTGSIQIAEYVDLLAICGPEGSNVCAGALVQFSSVE